MRIPELVGFGVASGLAEIPAIEATGQNEVFELIVDMAIGTRVPTKAIACEGMRRNPSPKRFRTDFAHRLIQDLNGAVPARGSQQGPENVGCDVTLGDW